MHRIKKHLKATRHQGLGKHSESVLESSKKRVVRLPMPGVIKPGKPELAEIKREVDEIYEYVKELRKSQKSEVIS